MNWRNLGYSSVTLNPGIHGPGSGKKMKDRRNLSEELLHGGKSGKILSKRIKKGWMRGRLCTSFLKGKCHEIFAKIRGDIRKSRCTTGIKETALVVHLELQISPRFSKKFETAWMGYAGAWGKLIHEKNLRSKISWHYPFKEWLVSEKSLEDCSVHTVQGVYYFHYHTFCWRRIFWDFSFYVRYSTLLHLPPFRFHCVGGCWDRSQDCCSFGIYSQTL